jgi:hypothetical protein
MEDSARPWQRGGCIHELSVLVLQQVVTGDSFVPGFAHLHCQHSAAFQVCLPNSHQSIKSNFVGMIKENSSFLLLNRLEDGLGVTLYLRESLMYGKPVIAHTRGELRRL